MSAYPPINYCSHCGHTIVLLIPEGDQRERAYCKACSTVHYQNPRNIAGTIPVFEDRVLLCRRAIEPRYGYWTLPAGFMEMGETTLETAVRETYEEAGARVKIERLFSLLNVPHANQVHLFYLATMSSPDFFSGEESLEVALFKEQDIPWEDIAFATVKHTLKFYFEDRLTGREQWHTMDVMRPIAST